MADPICRWRNASIKQVCEFNQILPKAKMEKSEARDKIETKWRQWDGASGFFKTAYQLAAQLGLYYEDDKFFYVRLQKTISFDEALMYLNGWGRNYYVPNPYTTSLKAEDVDGGKPVVLNKYLVNWVMDQDKGEGMWEEAKRKLFPHGIGNDDILQNLLNNYSDVEIRDGILKIKPQVSLSRYDDVFVDADPADKRTFFEYMRKSTTFNNDESSDEGKLKSRQIICYGAPGTGKSYELKSITGRAYHVRITFHPDSDYSSFVGAYKPTMEETGVIRNGKEETKISYKFVPQAFLRAYLAAWKNYPEPVYLLIEEINRGNCAQIFGDLFQLLDRNVKGFSDYPICADEDMKRFIGSEFAKKEVVGNLLTEEVRTGINALFADGYEDVMEDVLCGKLLMLPSNLYIYATMNTSDQSLFPIDSAFKRRWDWEYIPIAEGKDNKTAEPKGWKIEVNGEKKDWWLFLQAINIKIGATTDSEDKKMGYFFVKAEDGIIGAETFVSKVIFYLWNDVFKDYGFDDDIFLDIDGLPFTFPCFFENCAPGKKVNEVRIARFIDNVLDTNRNITTETDISSVEEA